MGGYNKTVVKGTWEEEHTIRVTRLAVAPRRLIIFFKIFTYLLFKAHLCKNMTGKKLIKLKPIRVLNTAIWKCVAGWKVVTYLIRVSPTVSIKNFVLTTPARVDRLSYFK